MLLNEGFFRLLTVGLLGIVFISATALAEKQQKSFPKNLFSGVEHIEEAEMINDNQLHSINLTSTGERIETIQPKTEKKK